MCKIYNGVKIKVGEFKFLHITTLRAQDINIFIFLISSIQITSASYTILTPKIWRNQRSLGAINEIFVLNTDYIDNKKSKSPYLAFNN